MNCFWFEPGYWMGWPWFGQIFWLLLLIALGYLVYRASLNGRRTTHRQPAGYRGTSPQGSCPNCGAPVEDTFVRCPDCHRKLKTNCPSCGKTVKIAWAVCPYCEEKLTKVKEQGVID